MESAHPGWEDSRPAARGVEGHDGSLLADLVQKFEDAEEASADARKEAEHSRDYYDGLQLTPTERDTLKARGQPEIIINRIKRKVDYLLGHERATRTDPKAYPRTQQEEGAAEAATDALRYVCDAEHFDVKKSAVWENFIIEGFGGVEITAEENSKGEINPKITQVPWDRIFFDPHSRRPDFSDARYLGFVVWQDEAEILEKWPESAAIITGMIDASSSLSDTYDDRPRDGLWADKKRRRCRIVQMYYIMDGVWYLCFFTKGGMLRQEEPVPYLDEDGRPECPLILQSAYIDRDNDRYGIVREMVGPQDEINKRRSKALHLISVRQTLGEQGAVEDVSKMKKEMAKPDGHVEIAPGMRFEKLDTSDMALSQFQLLQEAKQEIDLIGPNAAMTGKDDKSPSGRAILASQQGGTIELGPLSDALRQWQWRVYRQLWNRIKQFWNAEKWVRVTDDEEKLKWVGLNKPVTLRQQIEKDPSLMEKINQNRQQIQQTQPEMLAQFDQEFNQALDQVQEIENHVAEMDVDISLQDAPDTVTLAAEQFDQLAQMAGAGVPIPPDVLIEASSLRNKRQLLEKMKGQGEDPAAAQAMQMQQQLIQAKAEAEVQLLQAQAQKAQADAQAAMLKAQQPANQSPPPPPPTPLEEEEHRAKIELIRAQTAKTMVEAHVHARPPMMDPAKDELTRAQAHKTMVDAKVALRPKPKPQPEARA
jgi:hypothetical protein